MSGFPNWAIPLNRRVQQMFEFPLGQSRRLGSFGALAGCPPRADICRYGRRRTQLAPVWEVERKSEEVASDGAGCQGGSADGYTGERK